MSKALTVTAQEWADRVAEKLGGAVEAILAVGQSLIEAKNALEHGEWAQMFADSEDSIARPLPFSRTTAFMYIKIAEHPVLSNVHHGKHLPASWRTLYELTSVPERRLERAIERGAITPELERSEVKLLMPSKPAVVSDPVIDQLDAVERAVSGVITALHALPWRNLDDGEVDRLRLVLSRPGTELTKLEGKRK